MSQLLLPFVLSWIKVKIIPINVYLSFFSFPCTTVSNPLYLHCLPLQWGLLTHVSVDKLLYSFPHHRCQLFLFL